MACMSGDCWGWKCMTALTVVEIGVALFSSISWGTGFTEHVLRGLVDSVQCTQPCLKVVHLSFHDWQIAASVLYGIAVFFAFLSLLGLLSGQLNLQIPNVVYCILKIGFTIYICEKLLDAHQGPMMYKANRVFMYCTTVLNIVTLCLNVRQVKTESDRVDMEKSGRRPVEIRPLTEAFVLLFQSCNWCHCGGSSSSTYEVNSNEIRVPIPEDTADSGEPQPGPSAQTCGLVTASTDVDSNTFPPTVEASTPSDGKKHAVVDMEEGSLSNVKSLIISDKSKIDDLKDSVASRLSKIDSSIADEESRARKYTSGEDSQSEKSANDSRDRNADNSSEDVELQDETPLLKNR